MADYKPNAIPVCVVAGPTASGKTAVAIELAKRIGGEIICADSMQIYRGLPIGTAAPTPAELDAVPHHLFGMLDPSESYSVARYTADAAAIARAIHDRSAVPILCGGTGQYISAFVEELTFLDAQSDAALRAAVNAEYDQNPDALLAELVCAEPDVTTRLARNDRKRIVRAIELLRTTGQTIPVQNARSRPEKLEFQCRVAVLHCADRANLYARIERRVDAMLEQGILEEAKHVFERQAAYRTAAQAIGFKEFFPYFAEEQPLDACIAQLKQATRNYAKRQITWFKRMACAVWYDIEGKTPGELAAQIERE